MACERLDRDRRDKCKNRYLPEGIRLCGFGQLHNCNFGQGPEGRGRNYPPELQDCHGGSAGQEGAQGEDCESLKIKQPIAQERLPNY